jgi:hypothetical protein
VEKYSPLGLTHGHVGETWSAVANYVGNIAKCKPPCVKTVKDCAVEIMEEHKTLKKNLETINLTGSSTTRVVDPVISSTLDTILDKQQQQEELAAR